MAKAVSLIQPHAELIRIGKKCIETRSWPTKYRGEIFIHASKTRIPKAVRQNAELLSLIERPLKELDYGFIVAKAIIVGCHEITPGFVDGLRSAYPVEFVCGYYDIGRYAWILSNVEPLDEPIPIKGHLGIWNFEIGKENANE